VQAEDRIHRVGQTAEVVRYLYMISDGTIDKQMWASMQKKEQVRHTHTY
jgi:SNF2 family DNA or RNA helicase